MNFEYDLKIVASIKETEFESLKRRWPGEQVKLAIVMVRSGDPYNPVIMGDMTLENLAKITNAAVQLSQDDNILPEQTLKKPDVN